MIDKKISLGTVITICTILGTFIYTQGQVSSRIEAVVNDTESHSIKINKNSDKIQGLDVGQERIETKLDGVMDRFDKLETLIMEM